MSAEDKVNILLTDDQPESLLAMEAVLEGLGQNLVKARSGKETLRRLLDDDFAVLLLDVQMPDMDGFEVATLVRERERTRHIPIIFMTAAQKSEQQIFKGYELGAVDYMLKPIIPEILRSKVAVFVELAKKTKMIERQSELLREADRREHQKQIEDAMAFGHAVSHDLRAPLRHIESFSEILVKNYGDRLDAKGHDYLARLAGAARKMVRLIEAMRKLSVATGSKISREVVDLSGIAAELHAELRRLDPQRHVDVELQKNILATGDPYLLRLVMENLFHNAWKYTGRKKHAHIEFGEAVQHGTPVYFIRDNGVGFDMSHANKLFRPFSRLHSRSDFEGTGIGLATAQRIIQRHGGRIWGEAEVGRGTVFYFTLPSAQNPVPANEGQMARA